MSEDKEVADREPVYHNLSVKEVKAEDGEETSHYIVYHNGKATRHFAAPSLTGVLSLIERGVIEANDVNSLTLGEVIEDEEGGKIFRYDQEQDIAIYNRETASEDGGAKKSIELTADQFSRIDLPVLVLMRRNPGEKEEG